MLRGHSSKIRDFLIVAQKGAPLELELGSLIQSKIRPMVIKPSHPSKVAIQATITLRQEADKMHESKPLLEPMNRATRAVARKSSHNLTKSRYLNIEIGHIPTYSKIYIKTWKSINLRIGMPSIVIILRTRVVRCSRSIKPYSPKLLHVRRKHYSLLIVTSACSQRPRTGFLQLIL